MKPGYKITINELEKAGNIEKFKRDGVTREQLSKAMYKLTEGANKEQRTRMMERLHDRNGRG